MIERKELEQVGVGGPAAETVLPPVESAPSPQTGTPPVGSTIGIEPLSTHPVGSQIEGKLEEGNIGMDTPDLKAPLSFETIEASSWIALLASKETGAELPN